MRRIHTIAVAFQAIREGERPWTALGNFLNEWFDYSAHQRPLLVAEPLVPPVAPTDDQTRWAVYCAATVEWLCLRDGVPCPSWVLEPRYHLEHPWFHAFHPDNPDVQARLIRDTPEPFARRNIYSGNRMFANKYEFAGRPNRTL